MRWRNGGGEHYVAVRGGVLRVRDGKVVEIATREAVVNDDLGICAAKFSPDGAERRG